MNKIAELNHGTAREAADILDSENDISVEDLTAALVNALRKIDSLQTTIKNMQPALNAASRSIPIGGGFA